MCLAVQDIFEWGLAIVKCAYKTASEWSVIYDVFSCQRGQPYTTTGGGRWTIANSDGVLVLKRRQDDV